jgi:hypothetical protein
MIDKYLQELGNGSIGAYQTITGKKAIADKAYWGLLVLLSLSTQRTHWAIQWIAFLGLVVWLVCVIVEKLRTKRLTSPNTK